MLGSILTLCSGATLDSMDRVCFMSEDSDSIYLRTFCEDICDIYGEQFLSCRPIELELKDIVDTYTVMGFPGAAGCTDSMNLHWKNCRVNEKGQ